MLRRHHRYGRLAAAISATLYATTGLVTIAPEALAQDAPADEETPRTRARPEYRRRHVTGDPLRALGSGPSESSFGFAKSLLETPRSVSFISEEQITLFGISTVEDLTRLVPGTYTTTRYGLQGGINVRGVPSDMYYRGMKRLQMQGHVRTVLSAMDGIEDVKGPPSPIYGMGRIGGFQNFTPKSSRASTGAYMRDTQGFVQTTQGRTSVTRLRAASAVRSRVRQARRRLRIRSIRGFPDVRQAGRRAPRVRPGNRRGRRRNGPVPTRVRRSGATVDHVGRVHEPRDAGHVDNGTYLAGQPMANRPQRRRPHRLPRESHGVARARQRQLDQPAAEPAVSVAHRPSGALLPIDQFPTVAGVPATMLAYLNAHPEIVAARLT